MIVIVLPLLVSLVGLLLHLMSTNGKTVEIGRLMFWVGLLAFLLRLTPLSFKPL